jgi:hypothetical protein
MKIIGKTEEGILLSATEQEVSQILGFHSAWCARGNGALAIGGPADPLALGKTVSISDLYQRAKRVGELRAELDKAVAFMRGIAEAVETQAPLLDELAK